MSEELSPAKPKETGVFGEAVSLLSGPMMSSLGSKLTGQESDGAASATSSGAQTSGAWSVDFAGQQTSFVWIAALLVVIYLFMRK